MTADRFLAALADPAGPPIPMRTLVVVAHPDDEALGCGALLPRLADVRLIHVTDGAPRDGADARRHGFATPQAYADARRRELEAALTPARIGADRLFAFDVADQGAARALPEIARRLVPAVAASEVVLTHAFEGGHPDHDAVAFAVAAAARLVPHPPSIIEMPFYRAGEGPAWIRQSFAEDGGTVLRLNAAEREGKRAMFAAHATQAATLASFRVDEERYRPAGLHDFSALPNDGRLLYEQLGWGLTGAEWLDLVAAATRDLGLGASSWH